MTQQVKRNKKINKNKAGFVPGNILLILMLSGFSVACVNDIVSNVIAIKASQTSYEEALTIRDEKISDKDDLIMMETKLNDLGYLGDYIRATMFYTKVGETVFVTQANK